MWLNGTVMDWNARDRWFKPALFYLYFCTRKATHGVSNVTLGCVLYGTISTSVPLRPTTVQVSNEALVETKTDNSVPLYFGRFRALR